MQERSQATQDIDHPLCEDNILAACVQGRSEADAAKMRASPRQTTKLGHPSSLTTILRCLVAILSAPEGDQGGWEAGARGL